MSTALSLCVAPCPLHPGCCCAGADACSGCVSRALLGLCTAGCRLCLSLRCHRSVAHTAGWCTKQRGWVPVLGDAPRGFQDRAAWAGRGELGGDQAAGFVGTNLSVEAPAQGGFLALALPAHEVFAALQALGWAGCQAPRQEHQGWHSRAERGTSGLPGVQGQRLLRAMLGPAGSAQQQQDRAGGS